MNDKPSSFTGRSRAMKTAWHVKVGDALAGWTIAAGGIGTIVTVLFVAIFLFWRVLPLLQSAYVKSENSIPSRNTGAPLLHVALNEYQSLGWSLHADGELRVFQADTGEVIRRQKLFDKPITAFSVADQGEIAVGFGDGSVSFGSIVFLARLREPIDLPENIRRLTSEKTLSHEDGVVERTPQGQYRFQQVTAEIHFTKPLAQSAIVQIDHLLKPNKVVAYLSSDGKLGYTVVSVKKAIVGKPKERVDSYFLPLPPNAPPPEFVRLLGTGDNLYCIWKNGRAIRFNLLKPEAPLLAEDFSLLDDSTAQISTVDFILNQETLLCGDTQGRAQAWFRVNRNESSSADKWVTTLVHRLPPGSAAVTCLGNSVERRLTALGYADGSVKLFCITTTHSVLEAYSGSSSPVQCVQVAPKDDGIVASTNDGLWHARVNLRHPDVTLASLFLPVWYEGRESPSHVFQSSFAGTGPEIKLGLMPLVWGTIKAAFFSMLIGAPLALLAAIYTSEFIHPLWRAKVKSCIEIMASLPSVVLGFLAAIVFAPVVEYRVCSFLAMFLAVPFMLALGAHLWLLLPQKVGLLLRRLRLPAIAIWVVIGIAIAFKLGPFLERTLFTGDFRHWLDNPNPKTGWGMWAILFTPLVGITISLLVASQLNPLLRRWTIDWNRTSFALLTLAKFLISSLSVVGIALCIGVVLSSLGIDPRGRSDEPNVVSGMFLTKLVSTYEQRNSLLVGFVMGFAIIPIIYTIAEDALSTVPQHLRSAALGAGATPWQTAITVVIPTAMSGLFSALMIGLGRAVGETMIVLCAGGNTPEMAYNPFNGFRTLSATIAVELPEAVAYSTHERTLYLSAMVLFVLTFCVNTVAEIVRLRFRRRAYQL